MTYSINSTDRTYMWQLKPYVTWKGNNYNQASLINARPETNGSWILSKQGSGKDGNSFLPRPIKHWRKQLASNTIRGGTENVTISEIDRPGLYNMLNNNSCCDISKNSASIVSDIQVKNNSTIYDNSEIVVTYADVSNCWNGPVGKRICCNPEANLIKYKTAPVEKNYISYSYYLQSRCLDYNQNISTTKVQGNAYFNSNGMATYPTNLPKGCQVLQKKDCANDCCNCNCGSNSKIQNTIYKPNNRQFAKQGATSSKSRINALRENTIDKGGALFNNAYGLQQINNGICSINGDSVYYVKTKPTPCIQTKCGPAYVPPPPPPPCQLTFEIATGDTFSPGSTVHHVVYGNGLWVATGFNIDFSKIVTSIDGINWNNVTYSNNFNNSGACVTYGKTTGNNNLWVAVGGSGGTTILKSTDGINWDATSGIQFSSFGTSVLYNNIDRWVALGSGGNTILTSTDGITWGAVSGTTFSDYGSNLGYGNNRWVAVGKGTNSILYSDNGTNWNASSGLGFDGVFGASNVLYNGSNLWIAVGSSYGTNQILKSTDGSNWTSVSGTIFSLYGYDIAYGNGRWVAVGSGGNTILYSNDGNTWNPVSGIQFTIEGLSVYYNNCCWVAVGNGVNTILTSIDGITWKIPDGVQFDGRAFDNTGRVYYGDNKWVLVGAGTNRILYSN